MKRKAKKTGILILVIVLLTLCGIFAGGAFVLKTVSASYEMRIDGLETQISSNTCNVFVSTVDIKYGEVITADMVTEESHLLSYPATLFTAENIGAVAKMSVPAGTIMLEPMLTDVVNDSSEREVEYTCFYVSKDVEVGDYIDVRIRYQNGEDFVVLSKKRVERLSLTNATCFLMVTEEELQLMASAIVDVAEDGAVLYSNVYPMPEVQEAATVTYLPRTETNAFLSNLAVMQGKEYTDTSELRKALESRIHINDEGGGVVIDISNLKEYEDSGVSNTNDRGSDISSDYDGEPTEGQEEITQ